MSECISTVQYREIPDFPGYRVGDDGSVWSCRKPDPRRLAYYSGWKQLTPVLLHVGYYAVSICHTPPCPVRRYRRSYIHTLVLECFVGPRTGKQVARHLNGDPLDNRLSNLAWGEQSENMRDRSKHAASGGFDKLNTNAKLVADQVRDIREKHANGATLHQLARKYGVSAATVRDAVYRRTWAWLE